MVQTHRTRFLAIAAILLVLLIVIFTSLPVNGLSRNRLLESQGIHLRSGDVLIYDHERIWLLNPSNPSLELLLDITQEGLLIGGDVHISPQHDYIYMTAERLDEHHDYLTAIHMDDYEQKLRLIRYRLSDGSLETVADMPGLARVSPLSPSGERTILFVSPSQSDPSAAYYCLLEIETGDCLPLNRSIDINEPIWLSDNILISPFIDYIDVLSFEDGGVSVDTYFEANDPRTVYYNADIDPEGHLILAAYRRGEDANEPVLLSLDPDNFELSELPVTPTDDYHAAFNSISISPTGRYVEYQRWLRLEVQDLETGEIATVLDEVLYSAWLPDGEKLVVYYDADPQQFYGYEVAILDVVTGQLQTVVSDGGGSHRSALYHYCTIRRSTLSMLTSGCAPVSNPLCAACFIPPTGYN